MGRAKGKQLRMLAEQLVSRYPNLFSADFSQNKQKLKELNVADYSSKERNKLAGEIKVLVERMIEKQKPAKQAMPSPNTA